ncbi:MAG: ElyC/SanA/YdcF family protein, partial [Limisphaerales bacterium]
AGDMNLVASNEEIGSRRPSKNFWGIFTRKERWEISWRGWLILILALLIAVVFLVLNIQPFLAQTHRVNANVLVVEGWIHEYAVRAAVVEFQNGHYEKIYTTGGPIVGSDGSTNDFDTSASVGAELLEKVGMPSKLVQMVPSHEVNRDRTYSSAVALRNWFRQHKMTVHSFNVLTEDAHARRTRLLFQEAFGRRVAVGIISVPDPDYQANHWWRYSEGVREVLGESIAYLYAKILFHPVNS